MVANELRERTRFLGITPETQTVLAEFLPQLQAALPGLLTGFYSHIMGYPEMAARFRSEAARKHAEVEQQKHWLQLFSGRFDAEYHASVRRIGLAHARIGLDPRWYVGGYAHIAGRLYELALAHTARRFPTAASRAAQAQLLVALNLAVMLDTELAISIYLEENKAKFDKRIGEIAGGFERRVHGLVQRVATSAADIERGAGAMADTVSTTRSSVEAATSAVDETSSNVNSVAGAARLASCCAADNADGCTTAPVASKRCSSHPLTDLTPSTLYQPSPSWSPSLPSQF